MDFDKKNEGRFYSKGFSTHCRSIMVFKGTIEGKNVSIHLDPNKTKNYINIELANQISISESMIIKKETIFGDEFDVKGLQLSINQYKFISQFQVTKMSNKDVDIMLGSPWMESLDTFIFNLKKKFLTFSYKKKKITLWDVTMKSSSEDPSSEDLKDISKVILQDSQMSIQQLQDCQKLDQVITEKDEEISRLKNHSKNLIAQIKKLKQEKKSQQEAQEQLNKNEADHEEGLNKSLFEKNEENSRLRELNQKLIEQIKNFKNAKSENLDLKNKAVKPENNEELSRLRNHNRSLLAQIKKLKDGRKSQQQRFDQLANEESSVDKEAITEPVEVKTSSGAKIQTSEKGTSTDPIDVPVRENTYIKQVSSNQSVESQKVEVSTNILQENKIPYRHPNHKRRYDQQYFTYKENRQLAWKPKMRRHIQIVDQQTVPMKIDFGWITPQKMQHVSSGIRKLYRLISTNVAVRSTRNLEKTLRARIRVKEKCFPNYALRTKHF